MSDETADADSDGVAVLAERALVGALVWEPARTHDVAAWLEPDDFSSPVDRRIYEVVFAMVVAGRTDRLVFELPDALSRGLYPRTVGPEPQHAEVDWMVRVHERLQATPVPASPGHGERRAPEGDGRHVRYAGFVLEASTRRALVELGSQLEYLGSHAAEADVRPEVVIESFDRAVARLDELVDRLTASDMRDTGAAGLPERRNRITGARRPESAAEVAPRLTPRQLQRAETVALAGALTLPHLRERLVGRLVPSDFTDEAVGSAWAALAALHLRGEVVDYVTVAWQAERAAGGDGPPVATELLATIGTDTPSSAAAHDGAELVARAALLRYTADAGRDVQTAARSRGATVDDVVATAWERFRTGRAQARRLHPPEGSVPRADALPAAEVPTPRRSTSPAQSPSPGM